MSFRLLNVSSMYPGYLESFHKNNSVGNLTYDEAINLILAETTEFAGAYTKNFRKLGIDAKCIVANDPQLQNKWISENKAGSGSAADIISGQVKSFNPDILWVENLSYINAEWLRNIRKKVRSIKLVIAYHCAPYSQTVLEKLKAVDFVITCTPGIKQDLEKNGIRSHLIYHGFDNESLIRLNGNSTNREKFIFSGSLFPGNDYHNERINFIERLIREDLKLRLFVNLEKSYKIKIKQSIYTLSNILTRMHMDNIVRKIPVFEYGKAPVVGYSDSLLKASQSPFFGIDMYNLFNRSDIVLNMHVGVAGDYAGNMRMFEVTGIGSCLLTDNKKNLGDLFDVNNEIVVYDSIDDCIEKVKWLIDHEDERKKIALAGHRKTIQCHTVEDRCRKIVKIVSEELDKL